MKISRSYINNVQRENAIAEIGEGNVLRVVEFSDKGIELCVTDTGVILMYNIRTHKLITKMIARPQQIRNLYAILQEQPPPALMRKAYKNNAARLNEI